MSEEFKFYTFKEAAKKLRISESTLRHWVSQGKISHHKIGNRLVRFTDEDLLSAFHKIDPIPVIRRRRHSS